MNEFVQKARDRIKILKKEEGKTDLAQKEKLAMLRVSRDVLDMKIKQVNDSIDMQNVFDVVEINEYILKMESFLNEYFNMSGQYKHILGTEYDETIFEDDFKNLTGSIKIAKELRKKVSDHKRDIEVKNSEKKLKSGQLLKGENLSAEIMKRFENLELKYDQDLAVLGDYQILEISQDKSLDLEFNVVLEKVTDLSVLVPDGGVEVQELLKAAIEKRDSVSDKRKDFSGRLKEIVAARDVTADKLKNATTLSIELPKFGGYMSEMDFYTFKSEFVKLVEPVIQKPYLSDYLKRNYLCGSALTLVEKETDYSEIWIKLKGAFGNECLLLQNKLARLDNICLWKLRGDEKIADALASLLNTMKDLSVLAATHSIEGQLYEGGGLEKVMSLLGNERHRKFRSKNIESVSSKKSEWLKLAEFLQYELTLRN